MRFAATDRRSVAALLWCGFGLLVWAVLSVLFGGSAAHADGDHGRTDPAAASVTAVTRGAESRAASTARPAAASTTSYARAVDAAARATTHAGSRIHHVVSHVLAMRPAASDRPGSVGQDLVRRVLTAAEHDRPHMTAAGTPVTTMAPRRRPPSRVLNPALPPRRPRPRRGVPCPRHRLS
ncbi:hypothetical protein [Microbacterium sp. NPDC058345]|uniref:hypothetical protein n=1 Tax=Microbacterium sp. NPDC058345 TaxID=3346455 RepID=UPI0036518996